MNTPSSIDHRLTMQMLTDTAREAAGGGELRGTVSDGHAWMVTLERACELVEVRLDAALGTAEVTRVAPVALAA